MDINALLHELPLQNITDISPFNKGWSTDEKFIITDASSHKYLLRTGESHKLKSFKTHFNLLKYCREKNIPTHSVIDIGQYDGGRYVYLLMDWIEAEDLETRIEHLSDNEQYRLGYTAGQLLQKIHQYPHMDALRVTWDVRFNKKLDNKIKMYQNSSDKYAHGEILFENIQQYRHLLKDSSTVQHHGDFHIGNMLIDENHQLYIIDFDRHDTGEPFEEFNRIVWCSDRSPLFASGRINGYFNDNVPERFWKLLILYISSNTLSSLPWARQYGEAQMDIMRDQYSSLLYHYDDFRRVIPKWYSPPR
ncbi:aminoglycoside phosphotransferase family protein [Corticicoccus populi]|uniref:Aminoglycoside phosphotransferase family protein n=1 Tax=Corticicoccus populi TaxID=1812821 RepID=A0ABW5WX01_9STAP